MFTNMVFHVLRQCLRTVTNMNDNNRQQSKDKPIQTHSAFGNGRNSDSDNIKLRGTFQNLQGAYRIMRSGFPRLSRTNSMIRVHFPGLFHDHLCPLSMSFEYRLMEWISNKSDCRTHMLINHLSHAHTVV